jgi:hypothetical protein
MTIFEKINKHTSPNEALLYKEGAFWIAYEQSAYYFHQTKGYRPTKKLVKVLGKEVVSLGFPKLPGELSFAEKTEHFCRTILETPIDMAAFSEWKSGLPLQAPPQATQRTERTPPVAEVAATANEKIAGVIRSFDLSSKTPMECMLFLSELKKMV